MLITKQIVGEFLQPVTLTIARDGEQPLALFADEQFKPGTNHLGPKSSGAIRLRGARTTPRRDIPVVIFSASMRSSDVERTLSLGARQYVNKPIDMVSYRNAVLGMVRNWAMPE